MTDRPGGLSVRSLADVTADPAFRDDNDHDGRFAARLTLLGKALGTSQIGLTVTDVPRGHPPRTDLRPAIHALRSPPDGYVDDQSPCP